MEVQHLELWPYVKKKKNVCALMNVCMCILNVYYMFKI